LLGEEVAVVGELSVAGRELGANVDENPSLGRLSAPAKRRRRLLYFWLAD
jgi:hypothetical protein